MAAVVDGRLSEVPKDSAERRKWLTGARTQGSVSGSSLARKMVWKERPAA